ncbi:MAG: HAMP domain-containing histidine kinase [Bacteroidetes bacterium]|nr:MAG: HAMP domain-containing histidine kinase [Bacteroidota bacterium]
MKRERFRIPAVIILVTVSLAGLIALQVYLLSASYREKEQAFDRTVLVALNDAAQSLEKDEAASKIFSVAMQVPPAPPSRKRKTVKTAQNFSWVFTDTGRTDGTMRVEVFHSSGIDTLTRVMVNGRPGGGRIASSYRYRTGDPGMTMTATFDDSVRLVLQDTARRRRGAIVSQVVDKLFLLETKPLGERLERARLDSQLARSFAEAGIRLPYAYAVFGGDTAAMANDSLRLDALRSSSLSTRLYPNDMLSSKYRLSVLFPDRTSYLLGEMALLLSLSGLFIAVAAAAFVTVLRTLAAQRRAASSLVNFINNMTHEFKTPISTIALASEAIARPETARSRDRLTRYNRVIAEENARMKRQVEKVLQIAVLEEGDAAMKREPVEMNAVVRQAASVAAVAAEQRGGSVTVRTDAAGSTITGDPVHLSNIVHTILDNAVKYSSGPPAVTVTTADRDGMLAVTVRDRGIGIAKEHLPRLFEKYYRVPTGDTHDVKGFGLGLSYVKLVTELHRGSVSIHSVPGEGTTVDVLLPAAGSGR